MIIDVIKTTFNNTKPYNYSDELVSTAKVELGSLIIKGSLESFMTDMYLNILCSKVKYCIQVSAVTYSDIIIDIIFELEKIFKIDNLLDKLFSEED